MDTHVLLYRYNNIWTRRLCLSKHYIFSILSFSEIVVDEKIFFIEISIMTKSNDSINIHWREPLSKYSQGCIWLKIHFWRKKIWEIQIKQKCFFQSNWPLKFPLKARGGKKVSKRILKVQKFFDDLYWSK